MSNYSSSLNKVTFNLLIDYGTRSSGRALEQNVFFKLPRD